MELNTMALANLSDEDLGRRLKAAIEGEMPGNIQDYVLCTVQDSGNFAVLTSMGAKSAVHSLMLNCRRLLDSQNEPTSTHSPFQEDRDEQSQYDNLSSTNDESTGALLAVNDKRVTRSDLGKLPAKSGTVIEEPDTEARESPVLSNTRDSAPMRAVVKRFRVSEQKKVVDYLYERLDLLQQQVNKRLAKAWIKGICPKKQAKFPYQNKMRREKDGLSPEVPEWWPIGQCEFLEPDHISKEQRMALCMHLLRLRPTRDQFQQWNTNGIAANKTFEKHGWTAFLKELTPASIFDGLDSDRPDRCQRRQRILEDIYDLAAKEEEYRKDRKDVVHWQEDKVESRARSGRHRNCKRSRVASEAANNSQSPNSPIVVTGANSAKKMKRDPSSGASTPYEGSVPQAESVSTDAKDSPMQLDGTTSPPTPTNREGSAVIVDAKHNPMEYHPSGMVMMHHPPPPPPSFDHCQKPFTYPFNPTLASQYEIHQHPTPTYPGNNQSYYPHHAFQQPYIPEFDPSAFSQFLDYQQHHPHQQHQQYQQHQQQPPQQHHHPYFDLCTPIAPQYPNPCGLPFAQTESPSPPHYGPGMEFPPSAALPASVTGHGGSGIG